jgi:hypothetical protein
MNSRLLLTVVVLSLLALLALIGLQRALEEAVEQREKSTPAQEDVPPRPEGGAGGDGARDAESGMGLSDVANEVPQRLK